MLPALLPAITPIIHELLSLFPSKTKAAQAEKKLLAALRAFDTQQIAINRAEAAHASLFVAGWRPAIGWVCVIAIFWAFIGAPLLSWLYDSGITDLAPPMIETDYLLELVMAMLGLAGLRSFEKLKGVANR